MANAEIDEFAKLILENVRDRAIQSCDAYLRPENQSAVAIRWREIENGIVRGNLDIKAIIADCVDETIFQFFNAIDQELLPIVYPAKARLVKLADEGMGELGGSYMGNGGWRESYSKERHFDDFGDLTAQSEPDVD